tara:strand:- start:1978 stop:2187 length:210 start_codon:yes stop_codon:yes gene_type:complete
MIKVEGHPHLYRDEKSGAIINCDSMAYDQYVNSLRQKELQKNELDKIKDDIKEIKSLLKKLTMDNNINI